MDDSKYENFSIQDYLKSDSRITNNEKYLLAKLRTRMTEVKINFRGKYEDLLCPLCTTQQDNQSHLLYCNVLIENCQELSDNQEVEYEDIFSSKDKQIIAVKLLSKIWEVREKLMSN